MTTREKCYAEIRAVMKGGLRRYYEQFTAHIGDARSKKAIEHSTKGLEAIFSVLDQYEITKKETK